MRNQEVAFPRGCKHISDYSSRTTIYKKATPIHVRGALLYNNLLKEKKLDKRFPLVQQTDKIKFCYLKMPNPLRENVISCPGNLPRQLGLNQYIDYETQYDKSFVEPLRTILDAIGWKAEKQSSLDSFWS